MCPHTQAGWEAAAHQSGFGSVKLRRDQTIWSCWDASKALWLLCPCHVPITEGCDGQLCLVPREVTLVK